MLPDWFQNFATAHVVLTLGAAVLVAADVLLRWPQPTGVMDLVWPLTMLYWGPPSFLFYA